MTTAPKFYRYDNDGYFHSVITASRDPLESKIAGHDVYITPNSSTSVEPEKREGYWAHWNGEAWEYVALPKNADELIAFGKIKHDQTVPFWKKMNDLRTELLTDGSKYKQELVEGFWVTERLPDPTPEEIRKQKEQEVRSKRDYLISQTDFLVSGDYPISDADLAKVKAYRQALRDVPSQEGFPDNVVWPEMPAYKVLRA